MQEVMIMADADEMLELARVPPELWVKVEEAGGTMLTERLHEGKSVHRTYQISRAGLRTVLESVTRVMRLSGQRPLQPDRHALIARRSDVDGLEQKRTGSERS
jgi:hypothetical protein